MKILIILLASLLPFLSFAECNPEITFVGTNQAVVKEGHKDNVSLIDVLVEMNQYCPGVDVTMNVIIREESALIGKHIRAAQINQLTITQGNVVDGFTIGIIGDNDWNEDRTFSLEIVNPSHGFSTGSQQVTIENDDPFIKVVVPEFVKEPKKGGEVVPVKVELSMPATQRITGEIEILAGTATAENDYIAPRQLGFEILPGETYFEFTATSDRFIVIADDEKEDDESVYFYINSVKGATANPVQTALIIQDPATKKFEMTLDSTIVGIAEARVALTSKYIAKVIFEETDIEGEYVSQVIIPKYSHTVTGLPMAPKTSPGKFAAKLKMNSNGNVDWLQLDYPAAPSEHYPYNPNALYIYMSSFSLFHQDEFMTGGDQWHHFRIKKLTATGENQWGVTYKRNHREEGKEILREDTKITLKEID